MVISKPTTTRWIDKKTTDLKSAVALLIDDVDPDATSNKTRWENWRIEPVSEACEITLNNRKITYSTIKYSYDQVMAKDGEYEAEDMKSVKSGFIIAYQSESSLNYIIDMNSGAQKLLRRILSYTGKDEIERSRLEIDDDFFIWLINRMYMENRSIETLSGGGTQYELKAIRSLKGSTDDEQTKVSASGESVMNLISTLSFLLESRSLHKIQVDLSCTGHENISLILQSGTVAIEMKRYQGTYETDKTYEQLAKLCLMVYIEVLPTLLQEYHSDIENELWNSERHREFLDKVAADVQKRIRDKIDGIKKGSGQ